MEWKPCTATPTPPSELIPPGPKSPPRISRSNAGPPSDCRSNSARPVSRRRRRDGRVRRRISFRPSCDDQETADSGDDEPLRITDSASYTRLKNLLKYKK